MIPIEDPGTVPASANGRGYSFPEQDAPPVPPLPLRLGASWCTNLVGVGPLSA